MTYEPQYHLTATDRLEFLRMARRIVVESGVLNYLAQPKNTHVDGEDHAVKPGRGRPATRPQLTPLALLLIMAEVLWSGDVLSWANCAKRLWFGYTPKELKLIGLSKDWRDDDLAERMRLRRSDLLTRQDRKNARREWKNIVAGLSDYAYGVFDPIDDTALPANTTHTRADIETARTNQPHLAHKSAAKKAAMNALVWGALTYYNAKHFPHLDDPRNLHAGLLQHHKHDLGIDEHEFAVAQYRGHKGRSSAKQDSGTGKTRRMGIAEAIGITCAQAIARAYDRRVPNVILGFGLNPASPANLNGTRDALDAYDTNAHRLPPSGKTRHYLVADKAYVAADDMHAMFIDRGYSLVTEYPTDWKTTRDLATPPRPGEEQTTGPYLFNGAVVCPAARNLIRSHQTFGPPEVDDMDGQQMLEHTRKADLLKAVTMPTDGRIEHAEHDGAGRPSLGQQPLVGHYRLRVVCPAVAGKLRCPIITESMNNPDAPIAPDPPLTTARPSCCQQTVTRVTLTPDNVKRWQEKMAGTWEHHDLHNQGRNRTEFPFSQLTRRSGGNLNFGAIAFHKRGPVGIAIALAVTITNIRIMQQWENYLDDNDGNIPREGGAKNRRLRNNLMKTAATTR